MRYGSEKKEIVLELKCIILNWSQLDKEEEKWISLFKKVPVLVTSLCHKIRQALFQEAFDEQNMSARCVPRLLVCFIVLMYT